MSYQIIQNLSVKEKERRRIEYTSWLQDNGFAQQPIGTIADIIDQSKIDAGAVALTCLGRPYHRAAADLKMMTDRKGVVLKEYMTLNSGVAAALEELHRVHERIDEIVNELSKS